MIDGSIVFSTMSDFLPDDGLRREVTYVIVWEF